MMRRFTVSNDDRDDAAGLREFAERALNAMWMPDHLTPEDGGIRRGGAGGCCAAAEGEERASAGFLLARGVASVENRTNIRAAYSTRSRSTMHALQLVVSVAIVLVASLTCDAQLGPPPPGLGRYASVSYNVLGRPRWNSSSRVPGFAVTVSTTAPKGSRFYDVNVYMQYRRGDAKWEHLPVAPTPRGNDYRSPSTDGVFDRGRVDGNEGDVTFFIPHEICHLKKGEVDLRFFVKFFRDGDEHVPSLDKVINPFPANVKAVGGTIEKKLTTYLGPSPPVEIFDIEKQETIKIRPNEP